MQDERPINLNAGEAIYVIETEKRIVFKRNELNEFLKK